MTVTGPATTHPDPRRCAYATHPLQRPDCQLTAVLAYGSISLCCSCAQRRSTVGKGQTARPVPPRPVTPLDLITQTQDELNNAQQHHLGAVRRARQAGATWNDIAARLGVTRQAAQQRFEPR